jgi:hypothetical protein
VRYQVISSFEGVLEKFEKFKTVPPTKPTQPVYEAPTKSLAVPDNESEFSARQPPSTASNAKIGFSARVSSKATAAGVPTTATKKPAQATSSSKPVAAGGTIKSTATTTAMATRTITTTTTTTTTSKTATRAPAPAPQRHGSVQVEVVYEETELVAPPAARPITAIDRKEAIKMNKVARGLALPDHLKEKMKAATKKGGR